MIDDEAELVESATVDPVKQVSDNAAREISLRQIAYGRVFKEGGATKDDVHIVMRDLSRFCRAFMTTSTPSREASDRLVGRREVILRIMEFSRLSHETLFDLYQGRAVNLED